MSKTFGLDAEPKSNHARPEPLWGDGNAPGPEFQKEDRPDLPAPMKRALALAARPDRRQTERSNRSDDWAAGERRSRTTEIHDTRFFRDAARRGGVPVKRIPLPYRIRLPLVEQEKPLGRDAEKLLAEFFARGSFVDACLYGMTESSAGSIALGLKTARSNQIANEIKTHGGLTHDALTRWFQHKAVELIHAGRTPHGYEASKNSVAEAFYHILTGGLDVIERWARRAQPASSLDWDDLQISVAPFGEAFGEGLFYLIRNGLLEEMVP